MQKKSHKKPYQKSFGNGSVGHYSKEYMDVYCKWLETLTEKQRLSIQNCNNRATTAAEFRKKKRRLGKTNYKKQKYIDISKKKG